MIFLVCETFFSKIPRLDVIIVEKLPINDNEIVTVLVEVDRQLTVHYRII